MSNEIQSNQVDADMDAIAVGLKAAAEYNLEVEVICSAMRRMQYGPNVSIAEAIQYGLGDWDV